MSRVQTIDDRPQTIDRIKSGLWYYCLLPIACCLLLTLSSCFKEKNLAPPSQVGHGQTMVIEMGPEYTDQFFYSLSTNTVLKQNSRYAYDFMFDCDGGKYHVWLNTAKFMRVLRTGKTNMDSVVLSDTLTHKGWHYELGEFHPDSNAIGQWWDSAAGPGTSTGQVYLVDLGMDNAGNPFGYIKMKVNNFAAGSYSITYSDFVSPAITTSISKDNIHNYSYLTLTGGPSVLDIEPDKSTWDLCFTRYSIFFYDPYNIPYLVTGVLNNPSRTTAYMDSTITPFDSIKLSDFNETRLLTRRDAIGYEWKRFSSLSADGTYSINYNYTYYIKSDDDKLYKLRFFDFSKAGIRGYPSFEYYQLQ